MRTYIKRANGDCWSGQEWINLNTVLGARDSCDWGSTEAASGYLEAALASDDPNTELEEARVVSVEHADEGSEEAPQPPTRKQIAALQDEAAAAGDDAMVAICAAALDGDPVALAAAAQCISDAAAQRDE
jgi:hypothetical protein